MNISFWYILLKEKKIPFYITAKCQLVIVDVLLPWIDGYDASLFLVACIFLQARSLLTSAYEYEYCDFRVMINTLKPMHEEANLI